MYMCQASTNYYCASLAEEREEKKIDDLARLVIYHVSGAPAMLSSNANSLVTTANT